MGFKILNPVRDFRDGEETQRDSISKGVNKDKLYLILLLIAIGGILLWQNFQFVEDKTELVFSKLKAIVAPELLLFEDSELDLSKVNLESLLPQEEIASGAGEEEEEEEKGAPKPQLTLLEIQEEIDEIREEVEEVKQKVDKLATLTEIQDKIDEIREKVAEASQEVKKLTQL